MKVRLVGRVAVMNGFVVSQLVEFEEMEALVGRVKENAAQAIGEGGHRIILPGGLFGEPERPLRPLAGLVVHADFEARP